MNILKHFALSALLLILASVSFTGFLAQPAFSRDKKVTIRFCRVMKDWRANRYTPEELCKKYDGSFCSSMDTSGKAICAANGASFCSSMESVGEGICKSADGSFCSSMKTATHGICAALGGSFCDSISDKDANTWLDKLDEACKI